MLKCDLAIFWQSNGNFPEGQVEIFWLPKKSGSDWLQLGQIRYFSDKISVHFGLPLYHVVMSSFSTFSFDVFVILTVCLLVPRHNRHRPGRDVHQWCGRDPSHHHTGGVHCGSFHPGAQRGAYPLLYTAEGEWRKKRRNGWKVRTSQF